MTIGTSLGFTALILTIFLMHIPHFYSRTVFILSWVLALGFVPLARYLVRKVFIKIGIWGEPVAVIGTRPFMPQQREMHTNTYHSYIRGRPGLTGMWQVYGRSELQYDFRIQMDEYYFRNWSIWLDIYIMICTPWVVIRKIGAY